MSLKIIAKVPTLGLEIISDQRWINRSRDLIVNMDDDHLRNAVMWAYRMYRDEQGAQLTPKEIYGHTYYQWYLILKAVYDQRIENQDKIVEKSIQRLHQIVETRSYSYSAPRIHSNNNYNSDYNMQKDIDVDNGVDAWMY